MDSIDERSTRITIGRSNWNAAKPSAPSAAALFFPLDEELGLHPNKQWTPRLQAAMTRLGAKLPFREAVEELQLGYQVDVSATTVRQTTHENGRVANALVYAHAQQIQRAVPTPTATPQRVQVSADGCFICTTSGEWREVKTLAIGEVQSAWNAKKGAIVTRTDEWSYYSSADGIRAFEDASLAELHTRGVTNAEEVIAVNDGAGWIKSLMTYHCPQAVHILDFAHAAGRVAAAGKALMAEESDRFQHWYKEAAHRLKHQPPAQTLARLRLMHQQAPDEAAQDTIQQQLDYLQRRQAQIDYPYFLARHYPIGSGSVESAHKHVVQKRMKQAGMRWAEDNINPMLALRNLVANDRWQTGWHAITKARLAQRRAAAFGRLPAQPVAKPITLDSIPCRAESALPTTPERAVPRTNKPAPDHPWRLGIWPDPRPY